MGPRVAGATVPVLPPLRHTSHAAVTQMCARPAPSAAFCVWFSSVFVHTVDVHLQISNRNLLRTPLPCTGS